MSEEQPKYPIIEELAPATEEEMAFWETEEAWPNPDDGYDILGFPIRSKDDPDEDSVGDDADYED